LTVTYLRDISDHLRSITDNFETFEEEAKGMADLAFNAIAHSTNESMKILAVVSLVFLPLTLLCGIYGMNFDFFPELHWDLGFWYFWILATTLIVITLMFSRRMGWLSIQR
ncbi:hypothetical protein HDU91_007423, partial [Kappamyces sp. JEL0680]